MRKVRSVLLLFVLLALGLSFAVPMADVPETSYDESEALPYERTPVILDAMEKPVASTAQISRSDLLLQSSAPIQVSAVGIKREDAHRCAEPRVSLAFLCTLLC
jgi:hypothetical protein